MPVVANGLGCVMDSTCKIPIYDRRLNGISPFSKYQKQRIIQRVVRVPQSLRTMNLAAVNVYQDPVAENSNVNWNQMSDRAVSHIQFTGGNARSHGGNSRRRTLTSLKPGALSPGGKGDIKHNSYDRYLLRLKGKAPLKQEPIPANFADNDVPSRRQGKGGKIIKMGLLPNCTCGPDDNKNIISQSCNIDVSLGQEQGTTPCECPDPVYPPFNPLYGLTCSDSFIPLCNYNPSLYGYNILYGQA